MDLGPAAIDPLVEHRQQVVQDRAIGIEELVQEDELAFGEHAGGDRGDGPLAEPDQVDGAEDLVGLGEPGEQIFEIVPLDGEGKLTDQGRLGSARRPMKQEVLAGRDGQGDQVDDLVAADEPPLERLDDLAAESRDRVVHREPLHEPEAGAVRARSARRPRSFAHQFIIVGGARRWRGTPGGTVVVRSSVRRTAARARDVRRDRAERAGPRPRRRARRIRARIGAPAPGSRVSGRSRPGRARGGGPGGHIGEPGRRRGAERASRAVRAA